MSQVLEFFQGLFETSDWPPRWFCGRWTEFHGWLYIGSDITIWLAYFVIPVVLIYFIQKRPNIPFLPVFWLFGAFIILCGTTHLIDAVIFWWPGYRLSALLRFFTAIVSIVTALALIRDLPKLLNIKPDWAEMDLRERLDHKTEETQDYQSQIQKLKEKLSHYEVER